VPPVIKIECGPVNDTDKLMHPELIPAVNYYKITIADNGIGFDQQYAERMFVVFQRLNISSEYTGHGIGLAICNKIVSNHNGIIYAKGDPDVGSVFTVILPSGNRS
jgi:signal transduction histidine kinase